MLAREQFPLQGAKWLMSDILGAGLSLTGNVYWVKKTTDTDYAQFVAEHLATYKDATVSIYNTIQAAVDATQADRGDTIIICRGKWEEDVIILEKDGIHIFGQMGTGGNDTVTRLRSNDCATKAGTGGGATPYPFTTKIGTTVNSAALHILSRGVEVANIYFDGGGGTTGIYLGGGLNGGTTGLTNSDGDAVDDETASGAWIHDNFFRGGSEGPVGLYMNGSKFGCIIERNVFERWTGAGIQMDAGNASCESCIIRNNHFIADNAAYGIDIYGEQNSALGCQICSNYFGDRLSHAFTMALNNRASSSGVLTVMDNHFACANACVLVSTDFTSGNSAQHAGSATTGSNLFMEESAAGT